MLDHERHKVDLHWLAYLELGSYPRRIECRGIGAIWKFEDILEGRLVMFWSISLELAAGKLAKVRRIKVFEGF